MILGGELSERLTQVMTATAICCASATMAPHLGVDPTVGVLGVVEAVLGGTAVAHFLWRRRSERFAAVARRCVRQIDDGSDAWIDDEFRSVPGASAKRDAAIAAIRDVLPLIQPRPEELVAVRLSEAQVAAYYLERAAKARPSDFAEVRSNDPDDMARRELARRLFAAVVGKAYGVIARQPEFRDELFRRSLGELLQGQDALREDTQALRSDAQEILSGQQQDRQHFDERFARIAAARSIAERLAKSDPDNAGWQRDLSVSFDRLGDVLVAQGNLPEALRAFPDGLAIRERLARSDPDNAGWQRDVAVSHGKLGIAYGAGDTERARTHLAEGRAIIAELVEKFPDWAEWRRDLAWFDDLLVRF